MEGEVIRGQGNHSELRAESEARVFPFQPTRGETRASRELSYCDDRAHASAKWHARHTLSRQQRNGAGARALDEELGDDAPGSQEARGVARELIPTSPVAYSPALSDDASTARIRTRA